MTKEEKSYSAAKRKIRALQVFSIFVSAVAVGLLLTLLILTSQPESSSGNDPPKSKSGAPNGNKKPPKCTQFCTSQEVVQLADVNNPTVFQDLSVDEIQAVIDYLFEKSELNLTLVEEASVNSSYIFAIELLVPEKRDVLNYLDRNGDKPTRSAQAVVFRGDLSTPVVEEYRVSPLSNPNTHTRVRTHNSYSQYPIPYDARPMSAPEYAALQPIIDKATEDIHELLVDSFGYGVKDCSDKCLFFEDNTQLNVMGKGRQTVYIGLRDLLGRHLHPLGIEILISHSGTDVTKWKVEHILYNNQLFNSAEDLMAKYRAGNVSKLTLPFPDDSDSEFSTYRRRGPDPSAENRRGPQMYQIDGPRYKITGQKVEYMSWSFHFRQRPTQSVQLFDIRFKDKRIAYEISLQDITSFYSGHSLNVISSLFLDWSYVLTSFEMVKGIDCPLEASYLNRHDLVDGDEISLRKNVICVFEHDEGSPLMRHYANDYDGGYTFYGGVQDYFLILRTIVSSYNSDFVIDFCFHNNGAINVRSASTGYIIGTYDLPEERMYGFPVHDNVVGPLHHKMYHFKVDLDIEGTSNRFATYDISLETIPHPWIPSANKTQTRIEESVKINEQEARVFSDFEKPQLYVIYNENSTNSYGSKRGYKIINDGITKLLLPDEGTARALRWGKYQLAVTKYKDDEVSSSSMYALNTAIDPLLDFDRYLSDNDSIVDEDLVVWLTLGTYHVPTSEDVPSVSTTGLTQSFYLRPFNYFDEDASVSSRDAVYIVRKEDESVDIETFGRSREANCLPRQFGPLEYDGTW